MALSGDVMTSRKRHDLNGKTMARTMDYTLCKVAIAFCAAATLYGVKEDCDAKARELREAGVKCKVQVMTQSDFDLL